MEFSFIILITQDEANYQSICSYLELVFLTFIAPLTCWDPELFIQSPLDTRLVILIMLWVWLRISKWYCSITWLVSGIFRAERPWLVSSRSSYITTMIIHTSMHGLYRMYYLRTYSFKLQTLTSIIESIIQFFFWTGSPLKHHVCRMYFIPFFQALRDSVKRFLIVYSYQNISYAHLYAICNNRSCMCDRVNASPCVLVVRM